MLEYCTATTGDLSRMDCIDMLGGIREDIEGVTAILTSMAGDILLVEPEELLVCQGVLRLAAEALGAVEGLMKVEMGME